MPARPLATAFAAIALLSAPAALANGRFPASNQILFSPSDDALVLVRTTYGIFLSHDAGTTWTYLCESSLGLPATTSEDPALGLSKDDSLMAGLSAPTAGLDVSTDLGCNWRCVGGSLAGQTVVDVAVRPDAPDSVVALTSTFLSADAGGGTFVQAFQTIDDGATWAPLGVPITDTLFDQSSLLATTIDVAATDPSRLYVTATVGYAAARKAVLFVSSDAGQSWTEQSIPDFDPTSEASIFIGAVDPADADRVYLRTNALATGGMSRLFVTTDATDAGAAFTALLSFPVAADPLSNLGEILGFALSPDGSTIYAGSRDGGLLVGSRDGTTFTPGFGGQILCLATHGAEVWACSEETSGFSVGVSSDNGMTFAPRMHVCDATLPIACSASDAIACGADANASQCAGATYADLGPSLGCPAATDAGAPNDAGSPSDAGLSGGASGSASGSKTSTSACGCSFVDGPSRAAAFATAGMAALAWLRRRRRPLGLPPHADSGGEGDDTTRTLRNRR